MNLQDLPEPLFRSPCAAKGKTCPCAKAGSKPVGKTAAEMAIREMQIEELKRDIAELMSHIVKIQSRINRL